MKAQQQDELILGKIFYRKVSKIKLCREACPCCLQSKTDLNFSCFPNLRILGRLSCKSMRTIGSPKMVY